MKDLKDRTRKFTVDVVQMVEGLRDSMSNRVIARQLIRSASSVGANYRAACRAKSKADFINKLKIVEEELDESMYWMEILHDLDEVRRDGLYKEADELLSIIVASIKTVRHRNS